MKYVIQSIFSLFIFANFALAVDVCTYESEEQSQRAYSRLQERLSCSEEEPDCSVCENTYLLEPPFFVTAGAGGRIYQEMVSEGIIAQECAIQFPRHVKTLTLMCTTSGGEGFMPLPSLTEEDLVNFYSLPLEKAARIAVEATCFDPNRIDEIVKLRLKHPAKLDEVLKQKRAVDHYLKLRRDIESINCPTLIMTGSADRYVNPLNSKILKDRIPHSWLVVVDDSDHLFFLEKPQEVSSYVRNFIKGEICYDLAQ